MRYQIALAVTAALASGQVNPETNCGPGRCEGLGSLATAQ